MVNTVKNQRHTQGGQAFVANYLTEGGRILEVNIVRELKPNEIFVPDPIPPAAHESGPAPSPLESILYKSAGAITRAERETLRNGINEGLRAWQRGEG